MAKPIASYFASVGMDIDPKAIANVDAFLGKMKERMAKFQKYANDQKALQFTGTLRYRETRTAINTQLAKIGENLVLPIKNVKLIGKDAKAGIQGSLAKTAFNIRVNGKLSRESIEYMKEQLRSAFATTTFNVRTRATIPNKMPSQGGGGGGNAQGGGLFGRIRNIFGGAGGGSSGGGFGGLGGLAGLAGKGMKGGGWLSLGSLGLSAVNGVADASMSVLAAPFKAIGSVLDATSNSIMRAGMRAIPLIGGAYGLGQLNKANTELIAQRNSTNAIFSSGDYGVTGDQARTWLYNSAQRDGFNFKDALPSFNSFMASAMPSRGYEASRSVFEAFTQFGRTRGADSESMKGALYALSQMASKGQIMSEELNQQLAEKTGFSEAKGIFAEAWQMNLAKGGKPALTGEKAVSALGDAMKKGLVKFDLIAKYVEQLLRERAASGLEASRTSSSAAQARFENSRNKFLEGFSENGGEDGFRIFWETMAQGMERIQRMAPTIGAYFKAASELVSGLFLSIGEIYDFVTTGQMTSIAEWLQGAGFDVVALRETIIEMFTAIKTQFQELFGEGSFADRAAAVMKAIFDTGLIKDYMRYLQQTASIYMNIAAAAQAIFSGNLGDAFKYLKEAGSSYADRLGTSIRMGGSTMEVVKAAIQGKEYQTPMEKDFLGKSQAFEKSPLAVYEKLGATETGGMGFEEWKADYAKKLEDTARRMALNNGMAFNPGAAPGGPGQPKPWMPTSLGAPSIADMAANPQQSYLSDVAQSLQNQQMRHQVDVKLNLNVDVKTDESQLGLKISDSVKNEVASAIGNQLQSTLTQIPKY